MKSPEDVIEEADVAMSVKEMAYDILPKLEEFFGEAYVAVDEEEGSLTFWETESMDVGLNITFQDNS